MSSLKLLAIATLITSNAWAVQTRNCPSQIVVGGITADWFTAEEITSLPRHTDFTAEMLKDALVSADLVKHFNVRELEGRYQLNTKREGRCFYHNTDTYYATIKPKRAILLYTKQGKDFFRMDYSFKEKSRMTESFAIETELKKYSPTEIKISDDARLRSLTTVEHDCYDRRCLTDAWIGDVNLEASTQ